MKKKSRFGIFSKLIVSYILFVILVVATFSAIMLLSVGGIAGSITEIAGPFDVLDENGGLQNLDMVEALHGWVEVLDRDYRVLAVYGEKETAQTQYSQEEIYHLLDTDNVSDSVYVGGICVGGTAVDRRYYLTMYRRDVVSLRTTILLSNSNALSGWGNTFLVIFLTMFALECLGLSYYLSRKIRRPLKQMVEGMARIQNGDHEVRMDFKTEAEFEEIRDTFNLMMETIESQQQEKAELEAKKGRLLLELSHDIRTPLATIKSCAAALEADVVEEERKKEYYRNIDRKADRVCRLSEDMFLLLKMEDPEYRMEVKSEDICELLRQICAEYYDDAVRAGLELTAEIPEMQIPVFLDARLLSRAVGELLTNAIKYNRTGNTLRIMVTAEREAGVCIDIRDDGQPVLPELRAACFDAFTRGDAARGTDGGTGLGLSIVKAIAQKHGGTACYVRDGEWNCFRIRLQ